MPSSSVAVAASLLFLQVETLPAPTSTAPPLSVTVKSGRTVVRGAAGWVSVLQVVSRSAAAKPSAGRMAVQRVGIRGDLGRRVLGARRCRGLQPHNPCIRASICNYLFLLLLRGEMEVGAATFLRKRGGPRGARATGSAVRCPRRESNSHGVAPGGF